MKKIIYVFFLFMILGSVQAIERTQSLLLENAELSISNKCIVKKADTSALKDFKASSPQSTKSKKRKKAKGTHQALYVPNDYSTTIQVIDHDFVIHSRKSYFFQFFFNDYERGPPAFPSI